MRFMLFLMSLLSLVACSSTQDIERPNYLQAAKSKEELSKLKNNFNKLVIAIQGHYRNEQQQKVSAKIPKLEMVNTRIFEHKTDETWIYSEVFPSALPDAPFVQNFLRLSRLSRDTFLMEVFTFKDDKIAKQHVNAWQRETPFPNLFKKELRKMQGCDHKLVATQKGFAFVEAEIGYCEAARLENGVRFTKSNMRVENDRITMKIEFYADDKGTKITDNGTEGSIYNRIAPVRIAKERKKKKAAR